MLAIEKKSYPLQEKLLNAKTNEEKKAIRKQIRALKYVHVHIYVCRETFMDHCVHVEMRVTVVKLLRV